MVMNNLQADLDIAGGVPRCHSFILIVRRIVSYFMARGVPLFEGRRWTLDLKKPELLDKHGRVLRHS